MLLARVAEAVYWAGRYLERAEDIARIVQVHGETHIDLPVGEDVGWAPLIEIGGADGGVSGAHQPPGGVEPGGLRAAALGGGARRGIRADRPRQSVVDPGAIEGARDNLRRARPVVPREVWELCNELWIALSPATNGVGARDKRVRWLQRVIDEIQRINGVMQGTMRRDEAIAFFRMGQHLERAEITAGCWRSGPTAPFPTRAARSTARSTRWRCSGRWPRTSRSVGPCRPGRRRRRRCGSSSRTRRSRGR